MNGYVLFTSLMILSLVLISIFTAPGFSDFEKKISSYYIENSLEDTGAPNVMSGIVWDYRAFDTLGEETVLFASAIGVFAIFRKLHVKKRLKKVKKI